MTLEIDTDETTARYREEIAEAVRSALGERVGRGSWVLTLRKLPRSPGFVVDLTNRDGIMRQWLFDPSDPAPAVIARDLRVALGQE